MRITLMISAIGSGGAERAMTAMGNYWAARQRDVTLITLAWPHGDFYTVDKRVRRIGLGLMASADIPVKPLRDNIQRLRHLRRAIRTSRPDVVISFNDQTNVLTLLASFGLGVPVIVCEQVDPRQWNIGLAWKALRRLAYPQANALVVVSSPLREWAERIVRKDAVHCIPNPVTVSVNRSDESYEKESSGRTIAAMGRLTYQKGFDLLLRAFSRCVKKHAGWSLVILGEGKERGSLESLADELGIREHVTLSGQVHDPVRILRRADLFVMSSRYEGFPLALLEAMACGLAVISTDCPTGPGEIIRDGEDGLLVPTEDVDALEAAMDRLMNNQSERERLASRAVNITERFGLGKVMGMWEALLAQYIKGIRTCENPQSMS